MEFGEFIKSKRVEKFGMKSLVSTSKKLHITCAYLSHLENGIRYPQEDLLERISDVLDIGSREEKELLYKLASQSNYRVNHLKKCRVWYKLQDISSGIYEKKFEIVHAKNSKDAKKQIEEKYPGCIVTHVWIVES